MGIGQWKIVDLTGTKNGSNTVFTIPDVPDLQTLAVIFNTSALYRVASAPTIQQYMKGEPGINHRRALFGVLLAIKVLAARVMALTASGFPMAPNSARLTGRVPSRSATAIFYLSFTYLTVRHYSIRFIM